MFIFILSCMALLITTFLVMIAVQLLKMERIIADCTDQTEVQVKKLYGK